MQKRVKNTGTDYIDTNTHKKVFPSVHAYILNPEGIDLLIWF